MAGPDFDSIKHLNPLSTFASLYPAQDTSADMTEKPLVASAGI